MARIRSIKPEFPQSESMGKVSRESRLLFIQLWTLCDDEGRTRGNSRMLASLLFPYDDDAKDLIDSWMTELELEGCIIRYSHELASYVQICNWLNHQKIDKPSASKIPPPNSNSRILSNPLEVSSTDQGEDQGMDQGEERKGNDHEKPVNADPVGFAECWDAYPKRSGGNNRKDAVKAYSARLKSGVDHSEILAGTKRYAAFCDSTGATETVYVKQAASFYGSSCHFLEPWEIPKSTSRPITKPSAMPTVDDGQKRNYGVSGLI